MYRNLTLIVLICAHRDYILDGDIVVEFIRDIYLGRLNLIVILFDCVVKSNFVGVVVMTTVWRLEVHLLATLVVAVAVLSAAMDMLCVVCVARQRNNRVAAYPHKVYG